MGLNRQQRRAEERRARTVGRAGEAPVGVLFREALRCLEAGRMEDAERSCRRALAVDPRDGDSLHLLGIICLRTGRLDLAARMIGEAIAADGANAEYHSSLGVVLKAAGRMDDAIASYRRAVERAPHYADAHANLGMALRDRGQVDEAVTCLETAIRLRPDFALAHANLGLALKKLDRIEEAVACHRKAVALKPDYAAVYSNLLLDLNYLPGTIGPEMLAQAQRFGRLFPAPRTARSFANIPDPDRRLRIGYVSPDLRQHPVGYFMERVLAGHDRAQADVTCYYTSDSADVMTERLKPAADRWREIQALSDTEALKVIESDGIDVLVDLSGHTGGHRLSLFARRAAPLQVSWLGYFATTGLAAMDHVLADRFVVPAGEESVFTESVWRLPDSYLCFAPPAFEVPIVPRTLGAETPVTFGCFNYWGKISSSTSELWAEILTKIPGSRLFLKTHALADPAVRQQAEQRFAAHGIEPGRLLLEGASPRAELLASYNRVDIALDPFPYGGGTTTSEALWMGVPVVTLRGDRWVGRVSESILAAVGLPDLIAADRDAYVECAVSLATDPARISALRDGLRNQVETSALCDGPRFVRDLEAAYRAMWKAWCDARHTKGE
jgi:predicted O-linked N-acetylglucosamine transferase (SPINDLY family)